VVAAETAALSAWRILDSGDRVGALVFNDRETVEINPHRSEERVMQILRATIDLNHQLGVRERDSSRPSGPANPGRLNEVLQGALRVAKHDFLVVLISDCYGADEQTARLITNLCQHNDFITAFVYDPLEAEMPEVGRVVLSEGELQLETNTSDKNLQRRFKDQFQDRLQQAMKFSRTRSAPLLPLHTGEGVAEQIRNLLGYAGQPGSR
jgi:uncharacterized protein (DUF58 family)